MNADELLAWARKAATVDYYTLLGVPRTAGDEEVQAAFHRIALRVHPDSLADHPDEVRVAAAEAFKRAAEAYRVLSRAASRAKYDSGLAQGVHRFDDRRAKEDTRPAVQTLADLAKTKGGQLHARKADAFLSVGQLDDARLALISACQEEPYNDGLKERLDALYEALALEP